MKLKNHDVVALKVDLPEQQLVEGQVGTIVEILDERHVEVEFAEENGEMYALATLPVKALMLLQFSPKRKEAA